MASAVDIPEERKSQRNLGMFDLKDKLLKL